MRRWKAMGLVAAVGAIGVTGALYALMNAPCVQLAGPLICRVATDRPVVALTFDDGPTELGLDAVLPVLAAEGVHATFFLIGQEVAARPELVRRLLDGGHALGNHSYSHPRMIFMGRDRIAQEVDRTEALLRAAGATGPIPFRPPYGKRLLGLPLHLAERGIVTVTWDVAPEPREAGDPEALVDAVRQAAHPGAIILLHPMYGANQATRDALRDIIRALRQDGYGFATIPELLALQPPR